MQLPRDPSYRKLNHNLTLHLQLQLISYLLESLQDKEIEFSEDIETHFKGNL